VNSRERESVSRPFFFHFPFAISHALAIKGSPDRESYLPAKLATNVEGHLLAAPLKWGGSSDFVAFAQATALIIVPAGVKSLDEGARVKVARLPG
jgi:molybdopterin biosynthesis enzyme